MCTKKKEKMMEEKNEWKRMYDKKYGSIHMHTIWFDDQQDDEVDWNEKG